MVQPADLDLVWVKQWPNTHPFQAVWNEPASMFDPQAPAPVNIRIPWWEIWLWRPL